MPAIGLIHEDIADGQEGSAVAYGKVQGIDTSGYTEGQTVYVSNTSAGNVMNTKPYGLGDQIQNVGICIREHANNGVVFVTGVGRSNDIPNAPISSSPNYVYVNETNNDMKKIAPENLLTKLQTLEQVVNTGNTVANVISATGFTATQNVSIGGLTQNYIPIVGADNYLVDSSIRKDNGNIIISADTEITGDLVVTGNSYVVSSNSVVIEDRILGLANNNPSHDFDTGIIMEHPGHNVALIHHGDEDRFSMGYTQNTVTDNHVLPDSNVFFLDILGNVEVQNNLVVNERVGISNTLPGHDLSVGTHFYVDDDASNVVTVAGNVSATYFVGDGSLLTGLVTTLEDVVNNGNTSSNTVQLTNANVSLVATGNIEANYFVGDGSRLTGIATTLESVTAFGNTTSNTILLTNTDVGLIATGNIEANYFIGDGSKLSNVGFTLETLEELLINGNETGANVIKFQNTTSIVTTGNVGIANSNPTCHLSVGSNLCVNDTGSNVLTVEGNVSAHMMTLDSIQIVSGYTLEYVTRYGNTSSNTVEFTNETTGLVTTANVGIANSSPIHTLDIGTNVWVDDTGSNVLYAKGNVYTDGELIVTKMGVGNTAPQHDLSVASNLYVDDDGSNVLVVHGDASFGSTITLGAVQITPAYTLEEVTGEGNTTTQVVQFTNSNVGIVSSGGIVVNKDAFACKHYAYSNVSVPTDFANVAMTFASNVFHAKITAQLTHGNEEVSTMTLDVQGGTRDGTTSSLNIATGPGSVFGNTNTKPWNGTVSTTPTQVILEPSATGTTAYGVDLYVEYKSSAPDGKLESISIGNDSVKSFVY